MKWVLENSSPEKSSRKFVLYMLITCSKVCPEENLSQRKHFSKKKKAIRSRENLSQKNYIAKRVRYEKSYVTRPLKNHILAMELGIGTRGIFGDE